MKSAGEGREVAERLPEGVDEAAAAVESSVLNTADAGSEARDTRLPEGPEAATELEIQTGRNGPDGPAVGGLLEEPAGPDGAAAESLILGLESATEGRGGDGKLSSTSVLSNTNVGCDGGPLSTILIVGAVSWL